MSDAEELCGGELALARVLAETLRRWYAERDSQQRSDLQIADKMQELHEESLCSEIRAVLPEGYVCSLSAVETVARLSADYSRLRDEGVELRALLAKSETRASKTEDVVCEVQDDCRRLVEQLGRVEAEHKRALDLIGRIERALPEGLPGAEALVTSIQCLADYYKSGRASVSPASGPYRVGEELTGENGARLFVVRPLPDRYKGAITIEDAGSEYFLILLDADRVALIAGGYCAELPVEKSEPEKPVK